MIKINQEAKYQATIRSKNPADAGFLACTDLLSGLK
jgi:hypothetical protein